MSSASSAKAPLVALITALAVACAVALASGSPEAGEDTWVASWGTAVQRPVAGTEDTGPNWSRQGFADQSLRQVVRLTGGGRAVRIRLSNRYGSRSLKVAGATVGRSGGGALVWPDTMREVTFRGAAAVVVPPGGEVVSDAVAMETSPLERLAITLRFTEPTGPATFHRFTTATSYRARGDHLRDIGADAFTPSAVNALLAAKGRGRDMPVPVLVGTVRAANALVDDLGPYGQDLIDAFWPGPLTIIGHAGRSLRWDLGETKGTVALRMPLHSVALDLLKETGPMAVSSANRSGAPPATTIAEAEEQLGDSVAVYLDGGRCTQPIPSTIVDLTTPVPRVLRKGAVPVEKLKNIVGYVATDD